MAVQTFLDASTGHITTFDKTLLCGREHKFPTRVIPHDHGWWVNVPDKKELAEYLVRMCMAGFSISFVRLLLWKSTKILSLMIVMKKEHLQQLKRIRLAYPVLK